MQQGGCGCSLEFVFHTGPSVSRLQHAVCRIWPVNLAGVPARTHLYESGRTVGEYVKLQQTPALRRGNLVSQYRKQQQAGKSTKHRDMCVSSESGRDPRSRGD